MVHFPEQTTNQYGYKEISCRIKPLSPSIGMGNAVVNDKTFHLSRQILNQAEGSHCQSPKSLEGRVKKGE